MEIEPYKFSRKVMPELSEEEYKALKEDIEANGIRHPIDVAPDGDILDGHHRWKIAQQLGIEPPIQEIEVHTENEKKKWVINANLLRRQLTTDQKYLLYAEISKLYESGRGGDRRSDEFQKTQKLSSENGEEKTEREDVLAKTAEKVGESRETVRRARKYSRVLEEKPELREESPTVAIRKYEKERRKRRAEKVPRPPELDRGKLPLNEIICGDCSQVLEELPDDSVDMAMTSPPFWGLRDYGHEDQIGIEETPQKYVENLVNVFNKLKEVLKPTGTFYLNLGDTYSGSGGSIGHTVETENLGRKTYEYGAFPTGTVSRNTDLPSKCMSMIPERVVLAMVEDGWILRNKIIWNKPNPTPESVKDRFCTSYEHLYMFSLKKDYHFDLDAVREPYKNASLKRGDKDTAEGPDTDRDGNEDMFDIRGKIPGDVWNITAEPFPEAHFAVFPEKLCVRPIKASCPRKVCARCGTPYQRVMGTPGYDRSSTKPGHCFDHKRYQKSNPRRDGQLGTEEACYKAEFKGWKKVCGCDTQRTEKGVVLDPFAGAGTTCLVAKKLGRDFIGIELNPDYVQMARKRVNNI